MKLLQCPSKDAIYVCVSDVVVNVITKQRFTRDTHSDITATAAATAADNGTDTIVSICVSHDHNCLLAAYSNKFVYCFEILTGKILGKISLKKKPTALVQISMVGYGDITGGLVLVSDKEGSVVAISYPTLSKQVVVAGHTASIITDMDSVISSANSSKDSLNYTNVGLIATADRDEKIRISHVPHLETIQRYCLGHENVVTSVSFLKGLKSDAVSKSVLTLLVSCGWDGKILLWDACSGEVLDSIVVESTKQAAGPESSSSSSHKAIDDLGKNDPNPDPASGDDDIVVEEKAYDSAGAGNYPLKLCVSSFSNVVAAIYFGLNKVDIFSVIATGQVAKFGQVRSVELPSTPVDISFLSGSDSLLILLPKPHFLSILKVGMEAHEVHSIEGDSSAATSALIKDFSTIVSSIGTFTDFKQQLILSGNDGATAEAGIKKHSMLSLHEKHMADFAESVQRKKQKK